MKFSPLPVIMLMAGIILIYAAIRDVNPKEVVQNALQGKPTGAGFSKGVGKVKPPPSGFDPGAGVGKGSGDGGGGSW